MVKSMKIAVLIVAALVAAASAAGDFRFVVHGTGDSRMELIPAFNNFRNLLGGSNNGNDPGPLANGHRTVNWDAPIVPFMMPGNFFADVVDRGMTVSNSDDEFRVSNDGTDIKFNTINPAESSRFKRFSANRLFSPLSDNTFEVTFSVPGTGAPATVKGFGGVYVDVKSRQATRAEYLDKDGKRLARETVDFNNGGLSFLGVIFRDPVVAKVIIILGETPLDDTSGSGLDIVVMDDFIYGEPQAI